MSRQLKVADIFRGGIWIISGTKIIICGKSQYRSFDLVRGDKGGVFKCKPKYICPVLKFAPSSGKMGLKDFVAIAFEWTDPLLRFI
jgi:hypothetical protein